MQRLMLNLAYVIFGVIPSFLFFFWVERNCTLPVIPAFFEFSWAPFSEASLALTVIYNSILFFIFGFIHTYTAQISFQKNFKDPRKVYLIITGLSVFFMIAFWKNTGVVLWVSHLPWKWAQFVSGLTFVAFMSVATREFIEEGFLKLMGAEAGTPELKTTGIYARTRHPMYFFTLCAFTLSPMMSLDRATVVVCSIIYLLIAIPIEERKLVQLFGEPYKAYQKRVPALFFGGFRLF